MNIFIHKTADRISTRRIFEAYNVVFYALVLVFASQSVPCKPRFTVTFERAFRINTVSISRARGVFKTLIYINALFRIFIFEAIFAITSKGSNTIFTMRTFRITVVRSDSAFVNILKRMIKFIPFGVILFFLKYHAEVTISFKAFKTAANNSAICISACSVFITGVVRSAFVDVATKCPVPKKSFFTLTIESTWDILAFRV